MIPYRLNEIKRFQQQKAIFDGKQDPRPYTQLEIQEMSNKLISIWSPGVLSQPYLTATGFEGESFCFFLILMRLQT